MHTVKEKKHLEVFVNRFIDQINSPLWMELKIPELLNELSTYFNFKRGFIYQTDGSRTFFLRETYGNENGPLPGKFVLSQWSPFHTEQVVRKNVYYLKGHPKLSPEEAGILAFYGLESILIHSLRDTEGNLIGFLGFEEDPADEPLNPEELEVVNRLSLLLAKEVAVREYQDRGKRVYSTLKNILDNQGADLYVNSFDSHDILFINESMAAPYGGADYFRGKKCWEALYENQSGECSFCPRKHLIDADGRPTKGYSWDFQRPLDGAWFRVFSAAFDWTDGQLAQVITSMNITEQKRVEEELRKAMEKAERQEVLKSAFFANMTHEIRTPLNAIVGFSSLLAETDDREERMEYDHIVQENSELLMQLLSDILDLSRIESGNLDFSFATFSVKRLCQEIVRAYEVNKNLCVPIVIEAEDQELWIQSDKKRLMQVITNFINNALKFTTKGQITLGYHLLDEDRLKVFVRDTGTGIAADKLDQVFDRFVKLNTTAKGTGLGLAISKSIVEQLQGTIGVESEWGAGSCFWFTVPYDSRVTDLTEGDPGLFLEE